MPDTGGDLMDFDALIIGAGHNGLTCAYYLASKGLKVAVLEAADTVGGAAVTDEFLPGFRNSAASYTVSLLNPKVIRDMELERHGLKVVLRKREFPPGDDEYLHAGRNGLTRKEIVRLNKADGAGYDRYIADLEKVVADPPEVDPASAAGSGRGCDGLPSASHARQGHARAFDGRHPHRPRLRHAQRGRDPRPLFHGDLVKALFGFDGVVGNFASPYAPGAPTSCSIIFRGSGGRAWRLGPCHWRHGLHHAGDGPCSARKASISCLARWSRKLSSTGASCGRGRRGQGVASEHRHRGREPEAAVRSPRSARCGRRGRSQQDAQLEGRKRDLPHEPRAFGTSQPHRLPKKGDHLTAGIIMAPSLGYMHRASLDAETTGWSKQPIVESSFLDAGSRR